MDISSLMLTNEEIVAAFPEAIDATIIGPNVIAAAQLRKAVWAIQEWLETGPWEACCQAHSLEDMLITAGIPKQGE